ncbi:hypothetical protein KKF91_01220 [Myxococcota bacterium]|nr:hypothetical protein [Myxococcota bacterium]MBU1429156.1 hypothetical protein [Myxococcota bacterium]MBU1898785.1 hypothetical protein [Myxococcota bacterium]
MKRALGLTIALLLLSACADNKPAPPAPNTEAQAAKTAPLQAAKIKGQPAGAMPAGHGAHGAMPPGHPAVGGGMMGNTGHGGGAPGASVESGKVAGRISLAEGFEAKIKPGSIIFLMVRPVVPAGQPAPAIAARRIDLSPETKFPIQFVLGPRDIMQGVPMKGEVTLEARIDQDKDAISKSPGDLIGRLGAVKVDGPAVDLVINQAL